MQDEAKVGRYRIWLNPPAVLVPGATEPWKADEVEDYLDLDFLVKVTRFVGFQGRKGWCLEVLSSCLPDEEGGYTKRPDPSLGEHGELLYRPDPPTDEPKPETWRDREPLL
jgi:hypothetical protein